MKKKIMYNDLSIPVKIAIILSYFVGAVFIINSIAVGLMIAK